MDTTVIGNKRRYHIESQLSESGLGTIYKAFARRRSGRSIKRRYYALIERSDASLADFNAALQSSLLSLPYDARVEEEFVYNGVGYVVVAKGAPRKDKRSGLSQLTNKGYLMLLLAMLIMILMIVRFFQSPAEQSTVDQESYDEEFVEMDCGE